MSERADKHRALADTAPRGSREPGSPEWCYQTLSLMVRTYQSVQIDHRHFEEYLIGLREHRAWEKVPVDNPYGSEERMLLTELGKRADQIEEELTKIRQTEAALAAKVIDAEDRAAQRPVGRPEILYEEKNDIQDYKAPTGTSAAAALRRLRKDRPDIHGRVLAGELSPPAGMIEAGFREKAPSRKLAPFDRLRFAIERLKDQLTSAERAELRKML